MKAKTILAKIRDAVVVNIYDGKNDDPVYSFLNVEMPDSIKELEVIDFTFNKRGKVEFHLYFEAGNLPDAKPEARRRMTKDERAALATVNAALAEAAKAEAALAKTRAQAVAAAAKAEEAAEAARVALANAEAAEAEATAKADAAATAQETAATAADAAASAEDADYDADDADGDDSDEGGDEDEDGEDDADGKDGESASVNFNVTGDRRKDLVTAVSEILDTPKKYRGGINAIYEIGTYQIDRNGLMSGPKNEDLIDRLASAGFVPAPEVEFLAEHTHTAFVLGREQYQHLTEAMKEA